MHVNDGSPTSPATTNSKACRCGFSGEGPHPCHGKGYSCGNSGATRRFYNARPACLAGVQMKLTVDETWACDSCWEWFKGLLTQQKQ